MPRTIDAGEAGCKGLRQRCRSFILIRREDRPMDNALTGALTLAGPEACLAHYRDWAASYDSGFAQEMQYLLPAHVAAAFLGTRAAGPVLDVGAGTGLLAERLRDMGFKDEIDAVDFSPEMLRVADEKRLYAGLFRADITRPLALPRRYGGIVSSGTFTAGHVGPEALPHLLDAGQPGAQYALSINRRVFGGAGFDRALEGLEASGQIAGLQLIEVEIYGAAAARLDPEHGRDRGMIALFRKA
jgi:SAM-dependent methyltransferase